MKEYDIIRHDDGTFNLTVSAPYGETLEFYGAGGNMCIASDFESYFDMENSEPEPMTLQKLLEEAYEFLMYWGVAQEVAVKIANELEPWFAGFAISGEEATRREIDKLRGYIKGRRESISRREKSIQQLADEIEVFTKVHKATMQAHADEIADIEKSINDLEWCIKRLENTLEEA